jgi:hypothetical protein
MQLSEHLNPHIGEFTLWCDSLGYYSFFSSNGKTTIIILVSTELFDYIMYFNILTPSELSDRSLFN